jgi:hypothetical protein
MIAITCTKRLIHAARDRRTHPFRPRRTPPRSLLTLICMPNAPACELQAKLEVDPPFN